MKLIFTTNTTTALPIPKIIFDNLHWSLQKAFDLEKHHSFGLLGVKCCQNSEWEALIENGNLHERKSELSQGMIAGCLPWEIDRSQFSPQSQSTWSPHLPPTSSLPPPSQSAALTQSLAGSLADFTREKERTLRWQKERKARTRVTRPARRFAGY